jgi:hypothetical protein
MCLGGNCLVEISIVNEPWNGNQSELKRFFATKNKGKAIIKTQGSPQSLIIKQMF